MRREIASGLWASVAFRVQRPGQFVQEEVNRTELTPPRVEENKKGQKDDPDNN